MPKVFGLNSVAIVAASVAFFFLGFIWYGVLFSDIWMAAAGVTEADGQGQSPLWMLAGFGICVLQVIGLGLVLKWRGITDMGGAVKTAIIMWACFALAIVLYAYVYIPTHNGSILMVDASHLLVGWVVSAVILILIK